MLLSKASVALALVASTLFVSANDLSTSTSAPVRRSLSGKPKDIDGKTFDYVIIGGGQAGLVVASRLTEDSSLNVAVIEAGESGYDDNDMLLPPAANLYNGAVGTKYDWSWNTTAQSGLTGSDGKSGRVAKWPRGKVLGGSSAINGLYYVRDNKAEQDAWAKLIGNADDIWGWDNMYRAMKKSEDFTAPQKDIANQAHIQYKKSAHGSGGPINVSYPGVTYPSVGAFIQSAGQVSAPINSNPDSGSSWGTYVAGSTINPSNWTRSFSRTGYLDPFTERPNLHVITGHMVTKINFDTKNKSSITATGVNFQKKPGSKTYSVSAKREVILSSGTINDPQLLQLSGIGDANLLKSKKIDVLVNLPGVGQHLQDHIAGGITFKPKNASEMAPAKVTKDAKTDSYTNSAVSYVNTTTLFGGGYNKLIQNVRNNLTNVLNSMNVSDDVKKGYNLTYTAQIDDVFQSKVAPLELLHAMTFGNLQVEAALQHPLSRGSIVISSTDPFDPPQIDPQYFHNDVDIQVLREGFKLARKVAQQSPLKDMIDSESEPGNSVQSNADWEKWIRQIVNTEYHPSCTCSMLPRDAGGVVDKNLVVYGTSNLRVIDAAVPPLSISAHLMSVVYGIAEIGAELVMKDKNKFGGGGAAQGGNGGNGGKGGKCGNGGTGSNGGSGGKSGGGPGSTGSTNASNSSKGSSDSNSATRGAQLSVAGTLLSALGLATLLMA